MNKSFYTIISWVLGERKELWRILTVGCDLAEQIRASRLHSPGLVRYGLPSSRHGCRWVGESPQQFWWEFSIFVAFMITDERKRPALWCSLRSGQQLGNPAGGYAFVPWQGGTRSSQKYIGRIYFCC